MSMNTAQFKLNCGEIFQQRNEIVIRPIFWIQWKISVFSNPRLRPPPPRLILGGSRLGVWKLEEAPPHLAPNPSLIRGRARDAKGAVPRPIPSIEIFGGHSPGPPMALDFALQKFRFTKYKWTSDTFLRTARSFYGSLWYLRTYARTYKSSLREVILH